ncbi:MAG: prolyl oligopeptidase family serine peptidase, partial [Chitinophagales bacterium]
MNIIKNYSIKGSRNKPILLDIFYEASSQPLPVVIFSHGFKGFKDWGHFNLVAQQMAEAGFLFVKFNFSHNGTTPEKPEAFADLEAFGHNNLSTELDDLKLVIDFILDEAWGNQAIDKNALNLLGHSRGGGISILKAASDKRVSKLCTWSAVSSFDRFFDSYFTDEWEKNGVIYIPNSRTKQQMPLYKQYLDDLKKNADRLDILATAKKLKKPYLIVHGTDDTTVDYRKAKALKEAAPCSTLLTVQGG